MNNNESYFTIPKVAQRLCVTPRSVRDWIQRGHVVAPLALPTGESAYTADVVDGIERWYMKRAANGGTRGPGAKQRRERAQNWLADHPDSLANETADPISCIESPAHIVTQAVGEWLVLEDDLLPVVPLVMTVANWLPGQPAWLMIVAPPSSGKSDMIMGVSAITGVYSISTVTPKTFASGMKPSADGGKPPSLLERLRSSKKWLLTVKDFGTILSLPPQQRNPILGQLREIFDGKYDATFGTGVEIDWEGKLGLLVGATPAVDKYHKWSAELGERFVQFRPGAPDPGKVAMKAALVASKEKERKDAIGSAYRRAFAEARGLLETHGAEKFFRPEAYLVAVAISQFVAKARTPISHDGYNAFEVAESEGPGRLTKVFQQLQQASLICYAGDAEAATRLIVRIAVDSIPGKRGKALRELANRPDGITVAGTAKVLRCDDNTARTELDDLVKLGFAFKSTPAKAAIYEASDLLRDYAARIYLDYYEPEVSLRKLFDLPNNIIIEGEEEREE